MNRSLPNLILMGLRGSGKSTIARVLSERLGIPSVDLDARVLESFGGGSVSDVWRSRGERAFRAAEAECLREALRAPRPKILALGGGAPTAPGAADLLRRAVAQDGDVLVYLRAQPETLRRRLEAVAGDDRPSLTGLGTLTEIESVFAARDAQYVALASMVVQVDLLDTAAAADRVAAGYAPASA
ncbi:MAG: AAA family ATPase [Phycisphaerales bacterium]|nr:AAA family ATPase [Phycisphaerales bacterium]